MSPLTLPPPPVGIPIHPDPQEQSDLVVGQRYRVRSLEAIHTCSRVIEACNKRPTSVHTYTLQNLYVLILSVTGARVDYTVGCDDDDGWLLEQRVTCHSVEANGDCLGARKLRPYEFAATVAPPKPALTLATCVLSDNQRSAITGLLTQLAKGDTLWNAWGFGALLEKGRATSMLFYGPPGTGKTLTAEAIANELGRKLVLLSTAELESAVPGEMERTLTAKFAEARKKSQVLCFDECDSLIAHRDEVGMILGAQINCLLSQLERHDGVVIFTTNRLGKIDPAMQRRLALTLEFPFPDAAQRLLLWQRLLPAQCPREDFPLEELAQFPLAGGHIKNVVLAAARFALQASLDRVTKDCFTRALRQELKSLRAFEEAARDQAQIPHLGTGRGYGAGLTRTLGRVAVTSADPEEASR